MQTKIDDYIVFCWKGEEIKIPAKKVKIETEGNVEKFISNEGASPNDIIKYIEYLLYKSLMEK